MRLRLKAGQPDPEEAGGSFVHLGLRRVTCARGHGDNGMCRGGTGPLGDSALVGYFGRRNMGRTQTPASPPPSSSHTTPPALRSPPGESLPSGTPEVQRRMGGGAGKGTCCRILSCSCCIDIFISMSFRLYPFSHWDLNLDLSFSSEKIAVHFCFKVCKLPTL